LLSHIVSSIVDHDVSVLHVSVDVLVLNFNNLSFLIYNVSSIKSEQLPPSWIGSCTSDVGGSSIGLNVKWVRFPVVILDGLGNTIEEPLLRFVIDSSSLHHNIVGTNTFGNSTKWKFGHNVEWSIDMEPKVFWYTLGLWTLSLI
jgi:hypothetical protein